MRVVQLTKYSLRPAISNPVGGQLQHRCGTQFAGYVKIQNARNLPVLYSTDISFIRPLILRIIQRNLTAAFFRGRVKQI